jgi:hypothetical protein
LSFSNSSLHGFSFAPPLRNPISPDFTDFYAPLSQKNDLKKRERERLTDFFVPIFSFVCCAFLPKSEMCCSCGEFFFCCFKSKSTGCGRRVALSRWLLAFVTFFSCYEQMSLVEIKCCVAFVWDFLCWIWVSFDWYLMKKGPEFGKSWQIWNITVLEVSIIGI